MTFQPLLCLLLKMPLVRHLFKAVRQFRLNSHGVDAYRRRSFEIIQIMGFILRAGQSKF